MQNLSGPLIYTLEGTETLNDTRSVEAQWLFKKVQDIFLKGLKVY